MEHLLTQENQVSKLQAADDAVAVLPHWSTLIIWARDWWYADGSDDEASRLDEVTDFVADVSARLLGP